MNTTRTKDPEKVVKKVMKDVLRFSRQNHAILPLRLKSCVHFFSVMRVIRLVSRMAPTGANVLDVGCGVGHITAVLSSIGFNAIGFDIDRFRYVANINKIWTPLNATHDSQFMVADARKVPFKDETFNVIVAFAVLEHVGGDSEEAMFLKEINRILKRKGFFVISGLPTKYALMEVLGRGRHRRYTKKRVAGKLITSGLKPIYFRYDHLLPQYIPINFLNKLWNRLAPVIRKIDEKLAILPLSQSFIIVSVKEALDQHGDTSEGPHKFGSRC